MEEASDEIVIQHVYDLTRTERVPAGAASLQVTGAKYHAQDSGEPSSVGAVLTGRSIVCSLERQPAGTGTQARRARSEQFAYILQGTMMSDVEGDRVFASRGAILHIPAGVVHTRLACPDEDVLMFTVEDARCAPASGDDAASAAAAFPGFGSRVNEPRASTNDIIEQSDALPDGPGKRYVYDMRNIHDRGRALASAEVTPDTALGLPPGITGKLLSGERLHLGVLRLDPGARLSNYRRDNEQIVFVIEGELDAHVEEHAVEVPQYGALHIPPGVAHEILARRGAVIAIAQDKGAAPA